jgi:hypothetical protein
MITLVGSRSRFAVLEHNNPRVLLHIVGDVVSGPALFAFLLCPRALWIGTEPVNQNDAIDW